MNINSYKPAPVFGYNSEGKKHRAPIDVLQWLDAEIASSEQQAADFFERSVNHDYENLEEEIERHTEEGWLYALRYVKQYLEARND